MTLTPHHIGQIAKAQLHVAHILETAPADATDDQRATKIVEQLQALGWTPPRDLAETVPLRPERVADEDSPGRRAFREARAALANRPRDTPPNPGVA